MPNIKINELLEKTSLTDNDYTIVDDGTTTKKYKLSTLLSDSYTKAETDNLLSLKANQTDLNETNRIQKLIIQSGIGKLFNFVKRAYTTFKVNVQSGAIATTLEKMSGNSLVANQLVQNGNFTSASGWTASSSQIQVSNNEMTVTANEGARYYGLYSGFNRPKIVATHKYLSVIKVKCVNSIPSEDVRFNFGNEGNMAVGYIKGDGNYHLLLKITTAQTTQQGANVIYLSGTNISGTVNSFTASNFMLIDLTKMFGAGNEPTLEECQRLFTKEYYPYNEGSIVSANVDEIRWLGTYEYLLNDYQKNWLESNIDYWHTDLGLIVYRKSTETLYVLKGNNSGYTTVSKTTAHTNESGPNDYANFYNHTWLPDEEIYYLYQKNVYNINSTITINIPQMPNYPQLIPQAIQDLEGYGRGVGNAKNEIDFVNKKFILKGFGDTSSKGSVDLGTLSWIYNSDELRFYANFNSGNAKKVDRTIINNICCNIYETVNWDTYGTLSSNKVIALNNISNTNYIGIKNKDYTNTADFRNAMQGVMLYYELETPIETDITTELEGFNNSFNVEGGGTLTFHNPSDYEVDLNSNFENMEVIE